MAPAEEFRRKYASHMNEPVYLGYYFHLYIDKVFFSEYLPLAVEFLNETDSRQNCSGMSALSGSKKTDR